MEVLITFPFKGKNVKLSVGLTKRHVMKTYLLLS